MVEPEREGEEKAGAEQRAIELARWPGRAGDLTPEELGEIIRRTRRMARLMIDAASEEVLITDVEIRKHESIYVRRELIAAKITAWEWFFGPFWLGMRPRLSLEEVCPVLHMAPEWIRERVRQAKTGGKWVDGYMDGDTRVYGEMIGGKPIKPTRFKLPPGYRVAELYHEGDPLPSDNDEAVKEEAVKEEGEDESRGVSKKPRLSKKMPLVLLPPPSPERVEAARALKQSLDEGPKPPALPPEEEAAMVLRVGFDLLGSANVVLDSGK